MNYFIICHQNRCPIFGDTRHERAKQTKLEIWGKAQREAPVVRLGEKFPSPLWGAHSNALAFAERAYC